MDAPTGFEVGGTCLVRQPRLYDGETFEIEESIFLGRVTRVTDDGQVDGVTRLGAIPDDDEATITGDGTRVRLLPDYGLAIYPDTPTNRQLLRAVREKEDQAAALEAAILAIAAVAPDKLTTTLQRLLKDTGRYR